MERRWNVEEELKKRMEKLKERILLKIVDKLERECEKEDSIKALEQQYQTKNTLE